MMTEKSESEIPPHPSVSEEGEDNLETVAMGEDCCNDTPLTEADKSKPTGEIIKIADTECYISKPSEYPHSNSKLLLLLSNGVGVHSLNNQLQADHYAKEGGYLVVMPDLFEGDPAPQAGTTRTQELEEESSMLETLKTKAAEGVKMFMIDIWLARHTAEKTTPIITKVLAAAKEEFADAASQVFAVGYCFGGKYVLKLAATDDITAGALAHGTLVTTDDIKAVKRPVSFVCIDEDGFFPAEVREEGEKYLKEAGIEHEIKVYSKVPHGFAVYGSYEDQHIKDAQKAANGQMLQWLKDHES